MIVKELIKNLSKYPKDLDVIVTWEGVTRHIEKSNIYVGADKLFDGSFKKRLFIDGDENFYKNRFIGNLNQNKQKEE